ncbi:right-handed parallel beta-helix repeat-containing protein [Streptomyces sp. NPDC008137]|uniref:right-handed parallel beta-helix repeat-containing protein n=1 Tax=Streptomyces sp. NPDC008137 TaxID=3364813 RepID=UPI0036EC2DF6
MQWLNGLKITPERLMDNTADEVITSGLSVPSGWSVSSFTGTRLHGITEVDIFVTRTGADITESSAGSGNISGDPLMCTLPSGWAPPRPVNATWGNGSTDGEATIVTSGDVQLRSISGSGAIATGTNVRVTSMWISETPAGYSHDETTDITTYTEAGLFWVTGAAGDGVSDDLWAIQAQLDAAHAAGGGTVVIPAGKTYGLSTFAVVYDNTTIWAYGATLKAIGNSGLLRNFLSSETFAGYSGHSHIQVLGGTWDANAADAGVGTVTATTNCMSFVHCEDITVRDATITNVSSAHGLEFNSTSRGRAINCRFLGYKDNSGDGSRDFSEAIQIDMAVSGSASIGDFDNTASKDILVQGCQVGASSRLGSFGRGVGSHMLRSGVYYYGIQIIGNRIDGTRQQGIYGFGWRRAVISGNVVTGSGLSGIQLSRPDPAGAGPSEGYTINGRNISITGNTVEGAKDASGIRVFGASGGTYDQVEISGNSVLGFNTDTSNGIHVEYCSRPNVTGNTIAGTQSTGIVCFNSDGAHIGSNTVRNSGSNGVNVTGCTGVNVTGNTIDGTTANHGIFLATSSKFSVQGNWIQSAASAGVRLSDGAQDGTVTGNRIIKGSGTNGITVSATSAGDNVVANNDLTNGGWAVGTALIFSTAAITAYTGGTTSPGANLVS